MPGEDGKRLRIAVQGNVDLIALDARYHKTCYCKHTCGFALSRQSEMEFEVSDPDPFRDSEESAAGSEALSLVYKDVERVVIAGGQIVRLTQICRTYVAYLRDGGAEIDSFRADVMKH